MNGSWSSPATWTPARLPAASDVVSVTHAVTYDTTSGDVQVIGIEAGGAIRFAIDRPTLLRVGTLMVLPGGVLGNRHASCPGAGVVLRTGGVQRRPAEHDRGSRSVRHRPAVDRRHRHDSRGAQDTDVRADGDRAARRSHDAFARHAGQRLARRRPRSSSRTPARFPPNTGSIRATRCRSRSASSRPSVPTGGR